MIYLVTGQPGAGKSLYAISTLVKELVGGTEGRQIYYSGIADCMVPGWIQLDDPAQWFTLPKGSIILMDECQKLFRLRAAGSPVPEYVAKLETHRHEGYDLILITQHPMLLDTNVRRLIGNHRHVQRRFGMAQATVHEWHELKSEPDKTREGSIRHSFAYPVEAFKFYKSAEVHTHKRRIPARLLFFIAIPFLIGSLVWVTASWWKKQGDLKAKVIAQQAALHGASKPGGGASGVGQGSAQPSVADWLAARVPMVAGLPHTAPVYAKVTEPKIAPEPAGCVKSAGKGCKCFTQQGTRLDTTPEICAQIIETGYFIDWRDPAQERAQQAALVHPASQVKGPSDLAAAVPIGNVLERNAGRGDAVVLEDRVRAANKGRQPGDWGGASSDKPAVSAGASAGLRR
jgi:zona occludens toxin